MVQKVAVSREFEARLRHAATGKLSLSTQQKICTLFELGKNKATIWPFIKWIADIPFIISPYDLFCGIISSTGDIKLFQIVL